MTDDSVGWSGHKSFAVLLNASLVRVLPTLKPRVRDLLNQESRKWLGHDAASQILCKSLPSPPGLRMPVHVYRLICPILLHVIDRLEFVDDKESKAEFAYNQSSGLAPDYCAYQKECEAAYHPIALTKLSGHFVNFEDRLEFAINPTLQLGGGIRDWRWRFRNSARERSACSRARSLRKRPVAPRISRRVISEARGNVA